MRSLLLLIWNEGVKKRGEKRNLLFDMVMKRCRLSPAGLTNKPYVCLSNRSKGEKEKKTKKKDRSSSLQQGLMKGEKSRRKC